MFSVSTILETVREIFPYALVTLISTCASFYMYFKSLPNRDNIKCKNLNLDDRKYLALFLISVKESPGVVVNSNK